LFRKGAILMDRKTSEEIEVARAQNRINSALNDDQSKETKTPKRGLPGKIRVSVTLAEDEPSTRNSTH